MFGFIKRVDTEGNLATVKRNLTAAIFRTPMAVFMLETLKSSSIKTVNKTDAFNV